MRKFVRNVLKSDILLDGFFYLNCWNPQSNIVGFFYDFDFRLITILIMVRDRDRRYR